MDNKLAWVYLGSLLHAVEGLVLLDLPTIAKGHELWYVVMPLIDAKLESTVVAAA